MAKKGLPAIHPGEFLSETLEELGISQAAFARALGVSPMRIPHVVKGTRPVTAVAGEAVIASFAPEAAPATKEAACTVEQILKMKEAGLSQEQIEAACGSVARKDE